MGLYFQLLATLSTNLFGTGSCLASTVPHPIWVSLLLTNQLFPAILSYTCQPGQSKEAGFFMRMGNSYKEKESTSEAMALKGKMEVDAGLRAALTDADEGLLRPGCLPKVATSSAAGNKALLNSLDKAWETSREISGSQGFIAGYLINPLGLTI